MNDFKVFIPINKGNVSNPIEKVIETMPSGETRTRYVLRGIASTTSLDRDNERVSMNCMQDMANSIKIKRLPIFGNHEHSWENMLGYSDDAKIIDKQMHIKILTDYAETNPKINHLIGKYEAGLPLGLSIGGKVEKSKEAYETTLGRSIKIIDKVGLLETSVVGIASNPDAFLSLPGLPEQIAKSLKEGKNKEVIEVSDLEKSAGQSGETSYGKLGEDTIEAKCPECGRTAELRRFEDGTAAYLCNFDGKLFVIETPTKVIVSKPEAQPTNKPNNTIDRQEQSPLGRSKKSLKLGEEKILKGGKLTEENPKEEEKCSNRTAKAEAEEESETNEEVNEDEESYKRFMKNMSRYQKEMASKQEGQTTVPGGEAADSNNTLGGHGGSASPVHAKSLNEFNSMKKAFKEEAGMEGIEKQAETKKEDGLSFKEMRAEMTVRK